MIRLDLAASTRAGIAGAICLAILGGMIVGHAWPLWTGHDVLLAATVDTTHRRAPGEYVQLSTPAELLMVSGALPTAKSPGTAVRTVEPWLKQEPGRRPDRDMRLRGQIIYVQLETTPGGEYAPVSVSLEPVPSVVNLRGSLVWPSGPGELHVQYGIDAFYMQEGHAQLVEQASRDKRKVQMQVAIATSGRARIRNVLVDGVPVQ